MKFWRFYGVVEKPCNGTGTFGGAAFEVSAFSISTGPTFSPWIPWNVDTDFRRNLSRQIREHPEYPDVVQILEIE